MGPAHSWCHFVEHVDVVLLCFVDVGVSEFAHIWRLILFFLSLATLIFDTALAYLAKQHNS